MCKINMLGNHFQFLNLIISYGFTIVYFKFDIWRGAFMLISKNDYFYSTGLFCCPSNKYLFTQSTIWMTTPTRYFQRFHCTTGNCINNVLCELYYQALVTPLHTFMFFIDLPFRYFMTWPTKHGIKTTYWRVLMNFCPTARCCLLLNGIHQ